MILGRPLGHLSVRTAKAAPLSQARPRRRRPSFSVSSSTRVKSYGIIGKACLLSIFIRDL